jgi:DNA-binding beta-propeller fold protein YncE
MRWLDQARRRALAGSALALVTLCAPACGGAPAGPSAGPAPGAGPAAPGAAAPGAAAPGPGAAGPGAPLSGMPPVTDPRNVYADAGPGMLAEPARAARPLVYVPHTRSGDVWVIDPATFAVVGKYPAGIEVQHVVPSWDLRTLYATDDLGNTVTPFDPVTGLPGPRIPVEDPYNMYFSPDGSAAIVVAEARRTLIWYDPHTWRELARTPTPGCAGIDHADFTPDGRTAVFSCEFAGRVAVVDVAARSLLRMIDMPTRHTRMGPQDVKLAPDGSVFYVADAEQGSVWVLDGAPTRVVREIRTGHGAHGLYLDRQARRLFVTNRHAGTISVLDALSGDLLATWTVPGGSPDMGGLSADGSQLWLSGRYNREVYVLSTADGRLLRRIRVGDGPHGLCVWPQPGRYSLGHTGITR